MFITNFIELFIATLGTDGTINFFEIEIERLPISQSNVSANSNADTQKHGTKLNYKYKAKLIYVYDIFEHRVVDTQEQKRISIRDFSQVLSLYN